MDLIATMTLTGRRRPVLAAIHHASRGIRVPGTTAHPTRAQVARAVQNPRLVCWMAADSAH
jgi:hypothetical protein